MLQKHEKKKIYPAVIAAVLFTVLLAQRHAGFMLGFAVIPLLVWMIISLVVAARNPAARKNNLQRVFIWVAAVFTVVGIHYFRHEMVRGRANEIVAAIRHFSAVNGHCPVSLEVMGIGREDMKERLGWSNYSCEDGKPHLFYAATFIPFDTYHYDFERNGWKYMD